VTASVVVERTLATASLGLLGLVAGLVSLPPSALALGLLGAVAAVGVALTALWNHGQAYPKSSAEQDQLLARGEVDFNLSYTQAHAQGKIAEGLYPATVKSFVLTDGSLANTHFVAVAFNAPHAAAAVVLANLLLDPALQLSKNQPDHWGDFTVLDPTKLSDADRKAFADLPLGAATVPVATLAATARSEPSPAVVEALEKGWKDHVLHGQP
jgi:putative spermidine/putrescine transport system substrate-binding protein